MVKPLVRKHCDKRRCGSSFQVESDDSGTFQRETAENDLFLAQRLKTITVQENKTKTSE